MSLDDQLICNRATYLIEKIFKELEVVGQIVAGKTEEWSPDFIDFVDNKRFTTSWLQLADNSRIHLFERYDIVNRNLKSHYCYRFIASNGQEIFRADNSEHHDVRTSPHHIHDFRFGSEKIKEFYKQDSSNPDITEFFAHLRGERR